jgi:hypothetical protein
MDEGLPLPALDAPTFEHIAHHRAEMLRQHKLLANAWLWYVAPFVPGMAVMLAAMGRVDPTQTMMASIVCVLVFLAIALLNRRAARNLGRAATSLVDPS